MQGPLEARTGVQLPRAGTVVVVSDLTWALGNECCSSARQHTASVYLFRDRVALCNNSPGCAGTNVLCSKSGLEVLFPRAKSKGM